MNSQKILVENNLINIPAGNGKVAPNVLATILSNIAYYGFALSESAYHQLKSVEDIGKWWSDLEQVFKDVTGASKNMGDFVVYKNFPREVINMSEAQYWTRQILMYWGFPNEYFTEEEDARAMVKEKLPLKALRPATDRSLSDVMVSLLKSSVRWTPRQKETVHELLSVTDNIDVSLVSFKENLVNLALMLVDTPITLNSATDVLRLAVGMSDGDITFATRTKLRKFKRKERRFLLGMLEGCKNLNEDVARRREVFKRLFFALRPGDYSSQYPRVVDAYDRVYRGARIKTFNASLEQMLAESNPEALDLLKTRPGEFMRRLRVATNLYSDDAVSAFEQSMSRLTVHQLLKLERHLLTVNDRLYRTFPPKGNWNKLQIVKMKEKDGWDETLALKLSDMISQEVARRVNDNLPSVRLSHEVEKVKLQSNDSDLTPYGRGTVFDIPENITFLRSASYWKTGGGHYNNIWYDNGWNFFGNNWDSMGACCWNSNSMYSNAAVFSGDPTNSKDLEGRACQMIDLYLDKLVDAGIRYAVWNLLCYSRKSFDESEEVYAALQWGEDPQTNELFEPSRNVFAFPVRGSNMTKYVAYLDLQKRQLVYMDANLSGRVNSAAANTITLGKTMPAFVEYLDSLPSVYDLFKNAAKSESGIPIVYDDTNTPVAAERAYVFLNRNKNSEFKQLDLNELLKK